IGGRNRACVHIDLIGGPVAARPIECKRRAALFRRPRRALVLLRLLPAIERPGLLLAAPFDEAVEEPRLPAASLPAIRRRAVTRGEPLELALGLRNRLAEPRDERADVLPRGAVRHRAALGRLPAIVLEKALELRELGAFRFEQPDARGESASGLG